MRRQNSGRKQLLAGNHEALVLEREAAPFADQFGNFRFLEEELIEPGKLGEYLQVGQVLPLEISLRTRRVRAARPKAVPQLLVARIAPDQALGIRLEQVL